MKKNLYVLLSSIAVLFFSIDSYAQTGFVNGAKQSMAVCMNSTPTNIDNKLAFNASPSDVINWMILTPPANGALAGFPNGPVIFSGAPVMPTGTTYAPNTGYSGLDSFEIFAFVNGVPFSPGTKIYVTVDAPPVAGTITGASAVCVGNAIVLSDPVAGGAWSATNSSATVSGGVVIGVSAGIDTIIYSVINSCGLAYTTATVTINATPSAISGATTICSGTTSALSNVFGGGTWSSSNGAVATIDAFGVVTAGVPGTSSILYVLPGSCSRSTTVTVIASPAAISGGSTVCAGYILALSDASPGGLWSSSSTSIATVSPAGLATGVAAGTATITYKISSGCVATKVININPTSPITGTASACPGSSVILSTPLPGGSWTSGNTGVAVVSGGIVTGVVAGTAYITYTLTTGCFSFHMVTVNPSPLSVSGPKTVCIGSSTTLSDATPGGTWMSDDLAVASIGSTSGLVSGLSVGTSTITYMIVTTGCSAARTITVTPLPAPYTISGGGNYCSGTGGVHVYMSNSDVGTMYFLHLGTTAIGSYAGTGFPFDFGLHTAVGPYTATATNTATGCSNIMSGSASISVTPSVTPSVLITSTMGDTICGGTPSLFTAHPTHGGLPPVYQWTVNGSIVTIDTVDYGFTPGPGDIIKVRMIVDTVCATVDTVYDSIKLEVVNRSLPVVSLSPSPNDTICLGSPVTITPTPTYGGPSPFYYYILNHTILIGAGNKLVYKPADHDIVECYMISDFFCRLKDTVFVPIEIRVDSPKLPFFMVNADPPVLTGPGQTVTLTAIVTNTTGPFSYEWFVNGTPIPGATTDTYVSNEFTYMGNDSVTCVITRHAACYLTTFNWRKMLNNVGVEQVSGTDINISVLPNPNKGSFAIKGVLGSPAAMGDEQVSLELTNMMGQIVYNHSFVARTGIVNEQVLVDPSLANGMYMLTLRSAFGNKVFHVVIEQ